MDEKQLIRPPSQRPPSGDAWPYPLPRLDGHGRPPVIRIRHPGYDDPTNVLIIISAVDRLPSEPNQPTGQGDAANSAEVSVGLHYGTLLTIIGIIADNKFDVYLSKDREGTLRVDNNGQTDSDNWILPAGEYWAQIPSAQEGTPYPIVPKFEHWQFPHENLPHPWGEAHKPPDPPDPPPDTSTSVSITLAKRLQERHPARDTCPISAHRSPLEKAHIVPSGEKKWFDRNSMDRYITSLKPNEHPIDDINNIIKLRPDIHKLFDDKILTIVPKPVYVTPSPSASTSNLGTDPVPKDTSYALAVHVLNCRNEHEELITVHHNKALRFYEDGNEFSQQYLASREFLFARFA